MKKLFIVLLTAFVFAVVNPTKSEAKVMHDGAEVVKGQTGKMTFKKDIKVYKKNSDGTFESLVVKQNNFFRTYDIEKYDNKIFYQMGQYRVQATDLVVFKEVPIKIRSSFYNEPTYIIINRDGIYRVGSYGFNFRSRWGISFLDTNSGQLLEFCQSDDGSWMACYQYPGTDLKIAETIHSKSGERFELTKDAGGKRTPLDEAKSETMYDKGSVFQSQGTEVNGYLEVFSESDSKSSWLPANLLKPVGDK
ncbi:hypothetical protein FCT18_03320 [Lysinibacillus sphaericus]|uniref:Uncharacterized protein n=1 Tax=Lysinibacillus sphaericus TaxID=1421 RepID=A0A2S0JYF6_LYSSH|nr:hypothetical protein [Lysinibacillus sphaericus]AVK96167.1 hypothetical protein LS41612_07825 [Lysinibacillus sphaericus]MED4544552.1 hypothetical protein [Lysinibacillus sphaericus]TKI20679.1 hypothetical protein FCT18_03320 [Lysinibacillus sphaericus]SUV18072.1 Uncharacterised protein [Lysinibacillus sphaericus]GEC80710.1 hypothetical protein LSP03_04530 [Lysinibacillus sphaericus]